MFERFNGAARATVVVAQDSARALGHWHIGTEHVLLGVLRGSDEAAGRVLRELGVTREGVIAGIERAEQAPRDVAAEDKAALRTIGIDLEAVQAAIEKAFGPGALEGGAAARGDGVRGPWWRRRHRQDQRDRRCGTPPKGHIPFTPRAKKVLELSLREALALKHNYIGTEHILLGLVREGQGLGARILVEEGIQLQELRELVLAELQRAG